MRAAIAAATAGDTIDVYAGTYSETVTVNKNLIIHGKLNVATPTTIITGGVIFTSAVNGIAEIKWFEVRSGASTDTIKVTNDGANTGTIDLRILAIAFNGQ